MNVDDTSILLATQGTSHGANLFAYCENNPVNMVDYTGYWGKDVHQGAFDEEPSGKKYEYRVLYWNNSYIGFVSYNSYRGEYYGTTFWALQVGFDVSLAKILGIFCNYVDTIFSPCIKSTQGWHFNTSASSDLVDSRITIATFMLLAALTYFDKATLQIDAFKKRDLTVCGLECLGFALHPIQDYYAHTDSFCYTNEFGLKSHLQSPYTDSAAKRWGQLSKARTASIQILREIYKQYKYVLW